MTTYSFAKRVHDIPISGIGYMMSYAAKYPNVISLGQGTPLFPTPSFIYDAVYERARIDPSVGMYSSPKLENQLLELVVAQMQEVYGFRPELEELYLTTGGIGGLFAALMAFLEAGDEVIYFDPSYPLHLSQIYLTQARPVFVHYREESGWSLNLESMEKSFSPKTKMVILTNPNNPTGTVLTEAGVRSLVDMIIKRNLILVLDEAYEFLTYDCSLFSPLKIDAARRHVILCKSFSKEFAMTGWRLGYAYADREIIKKIKDVCVYFCISPATPSIVGAIAALSDPRGKKATAEFKEKFAQSRWAICERLDHLPKLFSYQKPRGAYYVFPKILGFNLPAWDFAKMLIDEARVITIPGTSMGPSGEGHLRLSFAAEPTIINQAFDRLDVFARKHNCA